MSTERDTTRTVRSWLETGVTSLPDRVLDRVLEEIAETPQRRFAWAAPRGLGLAAAAAMLAIVVSLGFGLLPMVLRVGDPDPKPVPTPVSFVPLPAGPLDAGRYVVDEEFAVELTFVLPDGWSKVGAGRDHLTIVKDPAGGLSASSPYRMALEFYVVGNLFADPCALEQHMLDPPVGPAVQDLADALANVLAYRASAPQPAVLSGYSGQRMTMDLDLFACPVTQADLWRTPSGWARNAQGEQERITIWILDVDGVRLVINAVAYAGISAEARAELDEVVDSIRIRPRADGG